MCWNALGSVEELLIKAIMLLIMVSGIVVHAYTEGSRGLEARLDIKKPTHVGGRSSLQVSDCRD